MKRIISLVLSAAIMLFTTACAADPSDSPETTVSSDITTAAATAETEPETDSPESTASSDITTAATAVTKPEDDSPESTASSDITTAAATSETKPETDSPESTASSDITTAAATAITKPEADSPESTASSDIATAASTAVTKPVQKNGMRDITTMELVRDMGYGINLGNTFEACGDWINGKTPNDFQQAWGSPVITKKIIQTYADAGFRVLRIPVAWSNMISDDGKYTIAPEYIDRVKEIVDWTLDSGMYAIINIHWDGGWINEFPENKEESMKRYTCMWTQISAAFEDYPDTLMFESQNEELGWDSIWNPWGGSMEDKKVSYALVNEVNQAFVDTIRAGGGNNPQRHLLISGYNTGIDRSCDPLFKMPDDPADRMALSVHYYTPSTLCILDKDASWGKAITEWGSEKDLKELDDNMKLLKENYIDKGIPVIVGEYGCFGDNKEREVKEKWMLTVSKAMYDIGACPVLWDTSGDECDRTNAKFRDPDFIAKLIEPAKE